MKDYFKRFIGINIESRDSQGNTMLNLAVQNKFIEGVEYLLKINANINTSNVLLYNFNWIYRTKETHLYIMPNT